MSAAPAWFSEVSNLCGGSASADEATLISHAAQNIPPAAVCTPHGVDQAAAVIRFAAAHRFPLLVRGGGTAQGIGYPPPSGALVLSTKNLVHGFAHEPSDIIATIPAGMTLGDAQKRLQAQGQWLPLNGPANATLGGLTATDRSGALAHGYGTLRDMVLGMTVINGDGIVRKCGGKVVKNVTGYALDKLYIGSHGTLGLITEITFKLRPLPISRDTWDIPADDLSRATALLRAIARKNLPLETLRVVHSRKKGARLSVSAAGTTPELDRIHAELCTSAAPIYPQRATTATVWPSLSSHASGVHEKKAEPKAETGPSSGATVRYWCVPSQLNAALAAMEAHADCMEFHAHGGSAALKCSTQQAQDVAGKLSAAGLNFRFENIQGLDLRERFGPPRPDWALMKQIHTALDPQQILNPGRFVV